jgi:hypothetical protein
MKTPVLVIFGFIAQLSLAQIGQFQSIPGEKKVYRYDPEVKSKPLHIPSPFANIPESKSGNARSSQDCSLSADIRVTYSGFSTAAQNAFQFAVDIWKRCIVANVPIRIDASFGDLGSGVLGSASIGRFIIDQGDQLPMKLVPYPVALANNIVGEDIYPSEPDIVAEFNSNFQWYFGLDGNTPPGQIDFVTVVLHEICHGLGFSSTAMSNGMASGTSIGRPFTIDNQSGLYPTVYDNKLENAVGTKVTSFANNSAALLNVLTSEGVFFDGSHANAANGGSRVELYAPTIYDMGSSISHLDESFNNTSQALMTYSLPSGESIHDPGSICIGMLEDIGWDINQNCFPTYIYINKNHTGAELGSVLNPYKTLNKAETESSNGSTIFFLSSGEHNEINGQILSRRVLLRLANGNNPVIVR